MRSYLLFSLVLSGCASMLEADRQEYVSASMQAYGSAAICCSEFNEMQFSPWDGIGTTLSIDASSKTYIFTQGKSFFSALQLPPRSEGKDLRVKSILLPGGQISSTAMLYPVLTFLDHQHLVIASLEARPRFFHAGIFSDLAGGGVGVVTVPDRAAFLVIHTDPAKFKESFGFNKSGGAGIVGGVYVPGSTYQFSVPYIPTGKVVVSYLSTKGP